jgi:hypothetical protein
VALKTCVKKNICGRIGYGTVDQETCKASVAMIYDCCSVGSVIIGHELSFDVVNKLSS